MEKIIVLDNEYSEASYSVDIKLAMVKWKDIKTIPSEKYREAFSQLLTYTENVIVINFISDARLAGVVSPADRKWFQEFAVPWAAKNGLKHAAIVVKRDPFKKYYMNAILRFVNRHADYDVKLFYDYDEALKWLLSFNDYQ
ncbi:MAG: hypothetical protein JXR68_04970 [Bacteroidales bacterium]|nr:hypothetical protein [Bacteroidales bacterium]